jgi:hypothetical protein
MIKSVYFNSEIIQNPKKLQLSKVGISEFPFLADVCKVQILQNLAVFCWF